MPDIFLSYSREDQVIARRYAAGFERAGFSVWWDQALKPGEAFDQVTEQALEQAIAVVVLWSKASVNSRWVRAEATQANANHRLMPVMVEACKRPIMFELTHTADLSGWQGNVADPVWQSFVEDVRRFVQRRASGQPDALVSGDRAPGASPAVPARANPLALLLERVPGRLLSQLGIGALCALAGATIAGAVAWQLRPKVTAQVARFDVPLTGGSQGAGLALSPDGRRIVYTAGNRLQSRRLDQAESTPVPDSEGGQVPFFSPDSRSVAYFAADKLKAFDFATESSRVLADIKPAPGLVGAWDQQGRIFYGQAGAFGISRVAAVGGVPEAFAALEKYGDMDYPDVLPGGKWVLFSAHVGALGQAPWSVADIVAQNVSTGERKVVLKGGHFARYLRTGHLVFIRGGTLFAVAFDPVRLQTRGREVPVVQGVFTDEGSGLAGYAVAANGTLAYVPGAASWNGPTKTALVAVGPDGESKALSSELRDYSNPRAAPDGSRLAVEVAGQDRTTQIWVVDAATGTAMQLTFDGEANRYPVWTPDGREVLFTSVRDGKFAIYRKAADGSGEATHVLDGSRDLVPTDVRGRTLIYQDRGERTQRDIFTFDLGTNGPARALLATAADESSGRISPNGAWIAYVAGESTNSDFRVYVRPYPDARSGQRAVSEGRSTAPVWSPAGDEIRYMSIEPPISVWSARVASTATSFTPGARRKVIDFIPRFAVRLLPDVFAIPFDVAPRGGEMIAVSSTMPATAEGAIGPPGSAAQPRVSVVLNWFEELKGLVPAD